MALHYFGWMIRIFKYLVNRKEVSPLPNDLIVEILSRLPAHQVLRCRKVCGKWKALTLTPRFTLLHATRAPSIIFLQYFSGGKQNFYFLDTKATKKKMLEKVPVPYSLPPFATYVIGCCNGLLLFTSFSGPRDVFYICNPFKPAQFILREPDRPGYLCGIYFHRLARDYRVLYVSKINNDTEYLVLSLRALQWRKLRSFAHWPQPRVAAVNIGGLMHWMVKHKPVIMTFTIETEEFNVRPCPGRMCRSRPMPGMQLLQMGSRLAFCMLRCGEIGVWVLEDYANWVWVNKYMVRLEWDSKRYPFTPSIINDLKVVTVEDGELVLCWAYRGLFRYHIPSKTLKKIFDTKSAMSFYMTSYAKSFVTSRRLKNYAYTKDIKKFRNLELR